KVSALPLSAVRIHARSFTGDGDLLTGEARLVANHGAGAALVAEKADEFASSQGWHGLSSFPFGTAHELFYLTVSLPPSASWGRTEIVVNRGSCGGQECFCNRCRTIFQRASRPHRAARHRSDALVEGHWSQTIRAGDGAPIRQELQKRKPRVSGASSQEERRT